MSLIIGSIAGGLARYFLSGAVGQVAGPSFPYGTFSVNMIGCFLIGILSVLAGEKLILSPESKILFMTGFCGAFTTFSAFILETSDLVKTGEILKAFLNVAFSVVAGFILFRLGATLARIF